MLRVSTTLPQSDSSAGIRNSRRAARAELVGTAAPLLTAAVRMLTHLLPNVGRPAHQAATPLNIDAGRHDVVVCRLGPRVIADAERVRHSRRAAPVGRRLASDADSRARPPLLPGMAGATNARDPNWSTATLSPSSIRWPTSMRHSSGHSLCRFPGGACCTRNIVPSDARALDVGCGTGRELKAIRRLLHRGEVVGIDLAAETVLRSCEAARASGLDHTAFAQADVGELPVEFDQAFDLVYCCLAHHHYPDPPAAAGSHSPRLTEGRYPCNRRPRAAWFNTFAAPVAKWSDPGWISFHTEQGFRDLLLGAGFGRVRWHELLPGFTLVFAQRTD